MKEDLREVSCGIATGDILEGKYRVGRILGAGAVGIVFEAKNVELDETVAIKCLRPEMLADAVMVGRFAREAKAAASIKSEYCASVYDVGTTAGGVPYIVMEYLDGKDLGSVVESSGPISPRLAVEYALQVCEALAVAHSKGIVHRDIKPENLLLTERAGGMRIVKVLDFGISKTALTGSIFKNELPIVKTVNLMGTPLYMSPEQVRVSDSVDVRSDIWSLGMVIYEMLTGETAFAGHSITEICASILEARPNPIEVHRSDVPAGLVEVITKCLQKDANKRYQNVAELALALMPFGPKRTRLNVERAVAVLQGSGQLHPDVRVNSTMPPPSSQSDLISAIPRPPGVPGVSTMVSPESQRSMSSMSNMSSSATPELSTFTDEPKKRRGGVIAVAIAVVVLAGVGVGLLLHTPASKQTATGVPTSETDVKPATAVAPVVATPASPPTEAAGSATARSTAATAAATATPKPFWGAPRVTAATPVAAAKSAPLTPTAKPKGTGKGEEPDLGY